LLKFGDSLPVQNNTVENGSAAAAATEEEEKGVREKECEV
jgi:hypothetical protein